MTTTPFAVGSPEAIQAIRNADPVKPNSIRVLGWLEGRGGSATRSDLIESLSRRTTYEDGVVGVHVALTECWCGVLFRRGYIRSDYKAGTVSLTTEGRAYLQEIE